MAESILLKQGGGGTGSDECTALREHVLASYTAVTKDSDDEPAEGTMPNRGAVSQTLNAGDSYTVPAGYHSGSGMVTANSLSSQTSATAGSGDILSGRTAYVNGNKITGSMPNRGAVSQALNAGGSYTVPAGYHNGSGKITANSLASQTGGATAGDGDVLTGKTYWKDGAKRTGSMANQGAKTSALNCGGSYTIPAGYHNGSGKVTANSLSSQTSATSGAGDIRSGKTAWVNGAKLTGTLAVTSAISFKAAALSYNTIRISWTNPAKGPWQGVFIQMSTSGYPGTGGGSRVYTGAGNNPNQAGGSNYVDIRGLSFGTTYYFTCTSYCDAFGWGASHNISATIVNASFGTSVTLDEAGYLPLLELDSTRVIGMKTYQPASSTNELVIDLSIMSTGKDGLSVLGTARKSFTVNGRMPIYSFITAFRGVSILRYSENGFYLLYADSVRDVAYSYLIKVTTTTNTITIHDISTYSCSYGHYDEVSNNPGYDFTSKNNEYGSSLISAQYYETETTDISWNEYKTLNIGNDGTITDTGRYESVAGTMNPKHDNRMIGGGSRALTYRITGNYEVNYRGFKTKTSGGLYLYTRHDNGGNEKNFVYAHTTMPNGSPYALISVPDGVYAYKDSNLWNHPVLTNPDITNNLAANRRYIRGIILSADMDRLVVHKVNTTSLGGSSTVNDFELYRFNRSSMTVGAILDTYTFTGRCDAIRACGQGIVIVNNPSASITGTAPRITRYIPT